MPALDATAEGVRIVIGRGEALLCCRRSFSLSWGHITDIRRVEDVRAEISGLRMPGTAIPGLLYAGSFGDAFIWARGRAPGVVIDLDAGGHRRYRNVAMTVPDPESVVARLLAARPTSG